MKKFAKMLSVLLLLVGAAFASTSFKSDEYRFSATFPGSGITANTHDAGTITGTITDLVAYNSDNTQGGLVTVLKGDIPDSLVTKAGETEFLDAFIKSGHFTLDTVSYSTFQGYPAMYLTLHTVNETGVLVFGRAVIVYRQNRSMIYIAAEIWSNGGQDEADQFYKSFDLF